MSIELFTAPLDVAQEGMRERAVEESGALQLGESLELQALVENARRSFGTAMAAVSIIYKDWKFFLAADGLPKGVYSRRASICEHPIAELHRVFCVPDVAQDPRLAENLGFMEDRSVGFHAGASLLDRSRFALGAFCVLDPKPRALLTIREAVRLRRYANAAMAIIGSSLAPACNALGLSNKASGSRSIAIRLQTQSAG